MMEIKTIRYLPEHIAAIEEFKRITHAYDEELKLIWAVLGQITKNISFDQMDDATCDRWASLMGISFADGTSLAEKRMTIKGRWASGLPYTEPKLREVLNTMLGSSYSLSIDRVAKTINVSVMLADVKNVDIVYDQIRAMVPADMVVTVSVVYNRWRTFAPHTWRELSTHTWRNIYSGQEWQEG